MAISKLVSLRVYVDRDLARRAHVAAKAHGGNISAYIRLLMEEKLSPDARPPRIERMVEYAVRGINIVLDHHDAKYKPQLLKKHAARYPGLTDAD